MKSSIYVKRQSFEVRLNSVISFGFVAFCQPRILRYSARDVTHRRMRMQSHERMLLRDKSDGLARKFRISFLSTKSRFLRGLPSNETPEEVTNQLFSVDSPVAWSWSTLSVRVMSCLPNSGGSGDRIDLARFAERF